MLSGYFDTVFPGPKLDAASYRKIATHIARREAEAAATSFHDDPDAAAQEQQQISAEWVSKRILFLTDNILEARAAREEIGRAHV